MSPGHLVAVLQKTLSEDGGLGRVLDSTASSDGAHVGIFDPILINTCLSRGGVSLALVEIHHFWRGTPPYY